MKASELVQKLQELIAEHGDLDVTVPDWSIESVEMRQGTWLADYRYFELQ